MLIKIKHRWTDSVICIFEATDIKDAVQKAVKNGANLRCADLRDTDLRDTKLGGANLRGADLRGADLRCADLRDTILGGANLRDTNLGCADLRGAYLHDTDLRGADLRCADLRCADLRDTKLGGANLRGADLRGANLLQFKTDIFDILLRAPKEIDGLKQSLINGKVDGSVYQGECACLVGTIANIRGVSHVDLGNGIKPNSSRPAEQWFMSISKYDTPETNQVSKITVEWIDEFQKLLEMAK